MLQRQDELRNIETGPVFSEAGLPLKMPEQLSTALEVGHKVQVPFRLETEFESDEEWTIERSLQDLPFADGVSNLFPCDDFFLRENFHSVYTPCVVFADLEHLTKGSATDKLHEFEVFRRQRSLSLKCRMLVHFRAEP